MRLLVLIGVLLAAARVANAQFPAEVRPGTRVRVWIPEMPRQEEGPYRRQLLRGTVESVDGGSLRLRIPGVERAVGGAIGGAITLALLNDPRRRGGPHYRTDWRAAGVGAAWGGGIGAVVGLAFPHERWHRVIR